MSPSANSLSLAISKIENTPLSRINRRGNARAKRRRDDGQQLEQLTITTNTELLSRADA